MIVLSHYIIGNPVTIVVNSCVYTWAISLGTTESPACNSLGKKT